MIRSSNGRTVIAGRATAPPDDKAPLFSGFGSSCRSIEGLTDHLRERRQSVRLFEQQDAGIRSDPFRTDVGVTCRIHHLDIRPYLPDQLGELPAIRRARHDNVCEQQIDGSSAADRR